MSVIIQGLKLPVYQGEHREFDRYGCFLTVYKTGKVELHIFEKDFDIKDIPAPHGKLIDADGVLRNNAIFVDREFIHPSMQVTLREIIDEAPTIIEAEVSENGSI